MWKNRLILLFCIIGSGVLVGMRGGTAAHLLFYSTLFIPVFSACYVCYVYIRFCIYQKLEHKTVVKKEKVLYQFQLANEDWLPYFRVSVEFFKDYSNVGNVDRARCYCLSPGEKIERTTYLTCLCRGEYPVGISHAKVTDYFSLFSITYPIQTKIEMKVNPRIVELENFVYQPMYIEEKERKIRKGNQQEILDSEVRQFVEGDSMRMVHWKVSAASGKLFSRVYKEEERNRVGLLVDFMPICAVPEEAMVLEDKIIEALLATAKYFWKNHIQAQLFYGMESSGIMELATYADIELLYSFCCDMKFQSILPMEEIVTIAAASAAAKTSVSLDFMLFTATLSKELFSRLDILQKNGVATTIFYMEGKQCHPLKELFAQAFPFVVVPYKEEPCPILEGRAKE